MSAFLEGIGKVFGKVADQFQNRIERLKNEKDKLLKEKAEIEKLNLRIDNEKDRKIVERYSVICKRIGELSGLLENKS